MNSGRGNREKEARLLYMLRINCSSPGTPPKRKKAPNRLINRNDMAMGMPDSISRSSPPKIRRRTKYHSIDQTPAFPDPFRLRKDDKAAQPLRANSTPRVSSPRAMKMMKMNLGTWRMVGVKYCP